MLQGEVKQICQNFTQIPNTQDLNGLLLRCFEHKFRSRPKNGKDYEKKFRKLLNRLIETNLKEEVDLDIKKRSVLIDYRSRMRIKKSNVRQKWRTQIFCQILISQIVKLQLTSNRPRSPKLRRRFMTWRPVQCKQISLGNGATNWFERVILAEKCQVHLLMKISMTELKGGWSKILNLRWKKKPPLEKLQHLVRPSC